jgi:hypothetical protein
VVVSDEELPTFATSVSPMRTTTILMFFVVVLTKDRYNELTVGLV